MLLKQEMKQYLKKVAKIKRGLLKAVISLDNVVYTEQNTEELNDVKGFVGDKINILSEIEKLVCGYCNNNLDCLFIAQLQTLKQKYFELSQDERLNYLQSIYVKTDSEETVYEESIVV